MAGRPKRREDLKLLSNIAQPLATEIFNHIADGKSLWKTAELVGVSKSNLVEWLEHPERINNYKRARARAATSLVEESIQIADGPANTIAPDGSPNIPDAARDKLRIQARHFAARAWDRDQYGERQQAGVTINMNTLHLDALRKAQAVVVLPDQREITADAVANPLITQG